MLCSSGFRIYWKCDSCAECFDISSDHEKDAWKTFRKQAVLHKDGRTTCRDGCDRSHLPKGPGLTLSEILKSQNN